MKDFFLTDKNCIERLFEEWKRHGHIIVAYEYDHTVYDHKNKCFFEQAVELIRECRKLGFHLIVFTSYGEDGLPAIIKNLDDNSIPYDAINETPEYIPYKGRKVFYNILLDSRAGLSSSYDQLWKLIYYIRGYKVTNNLSDVA